MKLTIVCPTYNEAENIKPLIETITTALKYVDHEIILADDNSEDRTWEVGERLRADYPHLRVLRRRSNRGLTPAVIDGFLAARGEFVACLDADLQHDPAAMVDMMTALDNGCDIAIGSRYVSGGSVGNWKWSRRMMSWLATKLATVFVGAKMSDPMSGYFMLRKTDFLSVNEDLNARGFKILVELVAKLSPKVIKEVPITFRPRIAGKSKLSTKVAFQYLHQLWRLSWIGNVLPVRFLKFGLVGSSGVIINLLVMVGVMNLLNWRNWRASMAATG